MPPSASIGNIRRGPQKAHIPYRGDNPQVGKKTGIAVQHVERKSDGFEPFEEIMQSADGLTPPQRRGWKKSLAVQQEEEDGEQSMQIDSVSCTIDPKHTIDGYLGPVQHLANLRPPVTPPTIGRRSSTRNGGPGPSGLSRTGSYREPEPPSDSPDREPDETGDQNVFGDYGPQEDDSPGKLPRETSFSQIEQDGDDDEEAQDPEETPKPARRLDKGKGKSKEVWHEPDEEAEDEIATELGGVDLEPESDASRDGRPRKNLRFTKDTVTRDKSQRKRGNKRMPPSISVHFPAIIAVFSPERRHKTESTKTAQTSCILARRALCLWKGGKPFRIHTRSPDKRSYTDTGGVTCPSFKEAETFILPSEK